MNNTLAKLELLSNFTLSDVQQGNSEALSLIKELYLKLYNKRLNYGCTNCHIDGYIELMLLRKKQTKETIIAMTNKKFIMNRTSLIDTSMFNKEPKGMFNHSNMTDEIALGLLKISQGYIKFFEKYPDNWKELLQDEKPQSETIPVEVVKEDVVTTKKRGNRKRK